MAIPKTLDAKTIALTHLVEKGYAIADDVAPDRQTAASPASSRTSSVHFLK